MPANDIQYMARALQLANNGHYSTSPNPRVGCVITKNNAVIAEGWHAVAGGPHAEIVALQHASGHTHGATAYVTLEPCSHHGKTGPCCEALINAGITRVVYGMQDPNPQVAGQGLQKLRDAGILVDGPVLETQARALNPGFIKRMETGLPFVRVKMAMSMDGRTAMASGESQWITGEAARQDVQKLRAQSCAILTAASTVLIDNAQLNVREPELLAALGNRRPRRVLLDQHAHIAPDAKIFDDTAPTLWCTSKAAPTALPSHIQHWSLPLQHHHADLRVLLAELAGRGCNDILVEAGATLAGAFLQEKLVDELIIYMAPKLLGSTARPLFTLPFEAMEEAHNLKILDVRAVGDDWRFTVKPLD
ncbi:MAG TPA: bifunctional diaminohydroxyphosphoribosylaminopyrimidine deaminase/5-amino-6-(5-phosphoribosylamino)uracil reductase RibD [Pseudomonadales bacterium]|nr:bifunctional diaminohydroxyphosphoribosylaminopyrimidine deaminase/5-amino-6-(5-phosphoribosylamino)uracil reductase RibD [Pseudomonadales bacterium]